MLVVLLIKVANPLLSNERTIYEKEAQQELLKQRAADSYEKYLGPGCYHVDRDFDHVQRIDIGNPMTSKVCYDIIVIGF